MKGRDGCERCPEWPDGFFVPADKEIIAFGRPDPAVMGERVERLRRRRPVSQGRMSVIRDSTDSTRACDCALRQFLRRQVFLLRSDIPAIARRILHAAVARAVEHVHRLHDRITAGHDRLLVHNVRIRNVELKRG